jgi:hypothetical protein
MHTLYVCCLAGGLAATLIFALLGALEGGGDAPSGAAPGAGRPAATPDAQAALLDGSPAVSDDIHEAAQRTGRVPRPRRRALLHWLTSWVSPLPVAAGILWYGGAGLAVEHALHRAHHLTPPRVALVAAIVGAAVMRSLIKLLVHSDTPALREGAAGAYGTISVAVRVDAAGEVTYTLEGLRRSSAARSVDGAPLPRGTRVVIARRERGIAWVVALDPLASLGRHVASPSTPERGIASPTRAPPTSD